LLAVSCIAWLDDVELAEERFIDQLLPCALVEFAQLCSAPWTKSHRCVAAHGHTAIEASCNCVGKLALSQRLKRSKTKEKGWLRRVLAIARRGEHKRSSLMSLTEVSVEARTAPLHATDGVI
jgi:hypothetical protein